MILDDVTGFWWENITGPQLLVEHMADSLSQGNNVVLHIEGGLPWREQLRDYVAHRLEQVRVQSVTLASECLREQIVPALLEALFRNELSRCPAAYKDQLRYLREKKILAGSVIWIIPQGREDLTEVFRFLSDYRGKDLNSYGTLILEVPEEQKLPRIPERVTTLRSGEYIRRSDLELYASILADGTRARPELKRYMTCTAVNLLNTSVEWISAFLQSVDFTQEEPDEALIRLWEDGSIPPPEDRPDAQALHLKVWDAQVQAVFAQIELERLGITEDYKACIEDALDTEYWEPKRDRIGFIQQWGVRPESSLDVELGTLVRMMALRRNGERDTPLLSFQDPAIRNRIIFLTECRNRLAHHQTCTPVQMRELLDVETPHTSAPRRTVGEVE